MDPVRLTVLAAALHASGDVIVMDNVKGFPPHRAQRFAIAVETADDFLIETWRRDPRLIAGVLAEKSRATILSKLGADDRTQAAMIAVKRGIIEL